MISSGLLLSIFFILSIQLALVSSETTQQKIDRFSYIWTNPTVLQSSSGQCCVPSSITIKKDSSSSMLIATYSSYSTLQDGTSSAGKCTNLLGQYNSLYLIDTTSSLGYISQPDMAGRSVQSFLYTESNGTLYINAWSGSGTCSFYMSSKTSMSTAVVVTVVVIIALIACCCFCCYQKRKTSSNLQFALNPSANANNYSTNIYPTNTYPNNNFPANNFPANNFGNNAYPGTQPVNPQAYIQPVNTQAYNQPNNPQAYIQPVNTQPNPF